MSKQRKKAKTSPKTSIQQIGFNPRNHFKPDDAYKLWNHEVIRLEDSVYKQNPPIEKIGIIIGLLSMNDEVELIVKFSYVGEVHQVTKSEFDAEFIVVSK
jgi:hypothetical protein